MKTEWLIPALGGLAGLRWSTSLNQFGQKYCPTVLGPPLGYLSLLWRSLPSLSLSLATSSSFSFVLSPSPQHSWASSSIPSCPSVICDTVLSAHLLVCLTSLFPFLFLSPKVFSIVLCLFNVNADGHGLAVP